MSKDTEERIPEEDIDPKSKIAREASAFLSAIADIDANSTASTTIELFIAVPLSRLLMQNLSFLATKSNLFLVITIV